MPILDLCQHVGISTGFYLSEHIEIVSHCLDPIVESWGCLRSMESVFECVVGIYHNISFNSLHLFETYFASIKID